jgi:acetyltransferase-like isoleucine patch superfamily enzyme
MPAAKHPAPLRLALKSLARAIALVVASPAAALCGLERWLSGGEGVFGLFAQICALLPGLPGMYLRRAFFQLTLDECSGDCYIGFGSYFTHRHAVVERGAYVGAYSLIGCAALRSGCLVGSHTSLLSGPALHEWDGEGWLPFNAEKLHQIDIGAGSWIGERAVIMADIGAGAMVAAGSVVSNAVPAAVMVAGNPARYVKRVADVPARPTADVPVSAI